MQKRVFLYFIAFITLFSCSRSGDFVQKGNAAAEAGHYSEAILDYRKAIQKDAGSSEAYYRLGLVHVRQNENRLALSALNKASELRPNDNQIKTDLADLCFRMYSTNPANGKVFYDKVVTISNALLAQNPQSFDGLRLQSQILLANRNYPEAIATLQTADTIKPGQPDVEVLLAQAFELNNQPGEAEKLAARLMDRHPGIPFVYDFLYRTYMKANRTHDAEAILHRKVQALPHDGTAVIDLAEHFFHAGDRPQAQAALNHLLSDSKDYPDGRLLVGELYNRMGNSAESLRIFEEGSKDPAQWALYEKRIAALLWVGGKRDQALAIMNKVVAAKPDDLEAARIRGSFLVDFANPKGIDIAIADYSRVVAKTPTSAILRYQLGRAYRIKGDRTRAKNQFQQAVTLNATYLAPRMSLAQIASEEHQYTEVLRQLDEIARVDPNNIEVHVLHAATLRNLNRISDAENELLRMSREAPNNSDVQLELGLTRLARGQFQDAEQNFLKVYRPGLADTRPATGLADAYAGQRDYARAIQILRNEAATTKDPVGLQIALADMLARSGDLEKARDTLRKAITADPRNVNALGQLGQLCLLQNRTAEAVSVLSQAAQVDPSNLGVQTALATALQLNGRADEAKATYRKILAAQPDNAMISNNLAFLLAEQGQDLDEALRLAKTIVQRFPSNPDYGDTLGLVYLKKRMNDSALQIFSSLTNRPNARPAFRIHYAMALVAKGDTGRARNELDTALRAQPSAAEQARIHDLLASL